MAISKVTGGGILDNTVTDADINSSKLNGVANSANNYTHPNHSGDVVSAADGAMTIQTDAVDISMLSATGTASNTTFLRGDNAWVAAGSTSASDLTSGTLPIARIADDAITVDKLANSINTSIAAKLPLAGGTMSGAIVLNSTNLTAGDSTSNANKIRMGASNDLNIHHDGSNSYIEDSGTGALRILGSSIEIRNAPSDNELMLKATTDGSVELYHNNVKKIETTATGVTVTGAIAGATNLGKITKVTMAYNSSSRSAFGYSRDLFARNNEMVGHKVGFAFVKASASTDIMVVFSMQVAAMRDCYQCATYSGTNYSSTFFKRFAFAGSTSIGDNNANQGMTITGTAIYTAAELDSTGTKQFYWAMGRLNDGNNSSYILNPNASDYSNFGGATTSTITVYEGDFT